MSGGKDCCPERQEKRRMAFTNARSGISREETAFMQNGIGKRSGSRITLSSKTTLVGRAPTCDLVISDLSVSRRHAELSLTDAALVVRDLESRNGTYVDERKIESSEVRAGQLVRFGSVAFLIEAGLSAAQSPDVETQSVSDARDSMLAEIDKLDLTAAQRRVFELLLDGLPEKQVAGKLKISPHTVHNHVRAIYVAASVGSRAELLARFVSREAFNRICIPSKLD
jgi:DNA-binding CsgD family transcriptional regulator